MRITRRGFQKLCTAAGALCLSLGVLPTATFADEYPSRTITMVVGFSAGGGVDIMARMLADKLAKQMNATFVVENQPGAGGTIAGTNVAQANPDGYTLLMVPIAHAIAASAQKNIPYDTVKDFAPVSLVATAPNVIVVNPKLPVSSLADLIALAKKEPGVLNFSSGGAGTSTHLAAELLMLSTGIEMTHIPYKGGGEALTAVLSGEVDLNVASVPAAASYLQAGQMKGLAVTSRTRSAVLPDIPTAIETGVDYEYTGWYGLVAPAGTPDAVVSKLHDGVVEILKDPEVVKFLAANGADPVGSTPEEFGRFLAEEVDKWAKAVKAAGL